MNNIALASIIRIHADIFQMDDHALFMRNHPMGYGQKNYLNPFFHGLIDLFSVGRHVFANAGAHGGYHFRP